MVSCCSSLIFRRPNGSGNFNFETFPLPAGPAFAGSDSAKASSDKLLPTCQPKLQRRLTPEKDGPAGKTKF
jgi:hypothetical protein